MTTCLRSLGRLAAALILFAPVSSGCDAPAKSVGQEGETDGGSASGCDTRCNAETGGGGETGAGGGGGDETGGGTDGDTDDEADVDCKAPDLATAETCDPTPGCVWRETQRISVADGACEELGPGPGYCVRHVSSGEKGCGWSTTCSSDSEIEYRFKEVEPGVFEVGFRDDCWQSTVFGAEGFTTCGNESEACECMCMLEGYAELPNGFEDTLEPGGCADMFLYGRTPDRTVSFFVSTGPEIQQVADAQTSGETLLVEYSVAQLDTVEVLVGENLDFEACNDASEPSEVLQRWVGTAGTVTIEVVPEPDPPEFGILGYATVHVSGLQVQLLGGPGEDTLEDFTLENVAVGWLPG